MIRETSLEANEQINPKKPTLRSLVLGYIAANGDNGATDEEIQTAMKMPANTQRPRRRELEQRRLIKDSGKRRKTISNHDAIVWVVCAGDELNYVVDLN